MLLRATLRMDAGHVAHDGARDLATPRRTMLRAMLRMIVGQPFMSLCLVIICCPYLRSAWLRRKAGGFSCTSRFFTAPARCSLPRKRFAQPFTRFSLPRPLPKRPPKKKSPNGSPGLAVAPYIRIVWSLCAAWACRSVLAVAPRGEPSAEFERCRGGAVRICLMLGEQLSEPSAEIARVEALSLGRRATVLRRLRVVRTWL